MKEQVPNPHDRDGGTLPSKALGQYMDIDNELVKAIVEACRPRTFEEDVRDQWASMARFHCADPGKVPTPESMDRAMRLADDFIVEYRKRFDPAVVKVRTR